MTIQKMAMATLILVFFGTTGTPTLAAQEREEWRPSEALIEEMESKLEMPGRAKPLEEYVRFYAGYIEKDQQYLRGFFMTARSAKGALERRGLPGDTKGIVILDSTKDLPMVDDGGCAYLHVKWTVHDQRIPSAICNGYA